MIDEKSFEYLTMAEKTVNHLDDTIREILEYSRNTRLGLSLEKFDLKTMAEQVYEDLRYVNVENISFAIAVEGATEIISDKSRINTVLRNIIGNAIKYRKANIDNSFIHVTFKRGNKNEALIRVEDNGEGISKEKLEKVFDMFYRGTSTGQGTGLGLYISREILNKLNASISIQSDIGAGTIIDLTIPQEA
jgi:signal transduction histidine kinase